MLCLSLFRLLQTEWLINNRNLLLIVKEGGKFKIKVWADSVSDEGPYTGSQMAMCPHTVERENSGLLVPFKGSDHIHEGSTLMT